jgi:hypothetical protein
MEVPESMKAELAARNNGASIRSPSYGAWTRSTGLAMKNSSRFTRRTDIS